MDTRKLSTLLFLAVAACAPAISLRSAKPVVEGPLVVEAVRPSSGAAGEIVLVTGAGFSDDVRVSFGGAPASEVRVVDDRRIEVVVPPGAGTVDVCISSEVGSWIALAGWTYEGETDGAVAFCFDASMTVAAAER